MIMLKTLFQKPVNRPIEGVIKADDGASLRLEVEEYVLTNEVEKRLGDFLDVYNNYSGANGVWISGFFGSGKSHLLKLLALLLENRMVEGASVLDLFLSKCGDNEILKGDLKKAASIPSKSILFNIDQKADVISKSQVDALIAVFVKVFDEACGYYGKQPYIAQFERDLDHDGLFTQFREVFKKQAGKDWEWGRQRSARVASDVDAAYKTVTGEATKDILDKYRSDHRLSIEDFAEQVNAYIDKQGKDFRLNFFVDEVGQYIAENTKLMTNLQTVAESLATKCRGRAWVFVTAQEDMNSVVGEFGKQQSNDFSKIMARFANRMKLTSADVEEVIRKRLLLKNEEGVELLSKVFHEQQNNFKTLFDFADGAQTYRNFIDREHFIHSYPFIPYQFVLFQSAIQNLSQHSAFEGKHSSVGERSMLGVFQQVAVKIGDHKVGQLATFDLMFEGIRTALKADSQRAIQLAERHLDNPFAVRLLKALFLVKYIKEFRATVRNLCVLMCEEFDQELPVLRAKVEEALNLLEQQTYLQRNGELYEYLTSEEKDIESEIKNTEVEATAVADELAKIIFDEIIKDRKIRLPESGQDYPFTRKLDERLHGREQELAIHIISPFHENADNEDLLSMQSMGKNELLFIMPPDDRLVRDLLMYKRTQKYVGQNTSISQRQNVKNILVSKGTQNQERYAEIRQSVQQLLGKASIFVSGTRLDIGGEDPVSRICKGFSELINRTYPNLRMLRGIQYREEQVPLILADSQGVLEGVEAASLPEPEQELISAIQSNNRGGVRTTLKNLIERFGQKPYGWDYAAILCTLAKLCARGKVEVRIDGNILENTELANALRNTQRHANVILEPQVEFTAAQVRRMKEFFEDFFDAPPRATEARALGKEFGEALKARVETFALLVVRTVEYPFLSQLGPAVEMLKEVSRKPYTWHLTELAKQENSLLELKESLLDPVIKFINGPQKTVYDRARALIQTQEPNFTALVSSDPEEIHSIMADPECFKGPRMQQLKILTDRVEKEIAESVKTESDEAVKSIVSMQDRMQSMDEFARLNADQKSQLALVFANCRKQVENAKLMAVIRDTVRRFEEKEYQALLARMNRWATPVEAEKDGRVKEGSNLYMAVRTIAVPFDKAWLADEADVERYLVAMREVLLAEVRSGKRIQI
jgi:hypothetical protein